MNCKRCGMFFYSDARTDRQDKNPEVENCNDCNMKPMKQITRRGDWCYPHAGELDEQLRPIDEYGNLYKAGVRSCGYSDCTRKAHIIPYPVKELA